MIDKRRSAGVVSSANLVAGEVTGQSVLVFDDLIASGETMRRAAVALREHGARDVIAVAAHGLFIAPAAEVLADASITELGVSDSVPPFRLPADGETVRKLECISVAPLLTQAIRASHAAWIHAPGHASSARTARAT
jgi:ribose-phosphate pyrophosphokinase